MRIFGWNVSRTIRKAQNILNSPVTWGAGGWFPVIRESFPGAWQRNLDCRPETVLSSPVVFACITRIASDIAKMRFKLMAETPKNSGIYTEVSSPAFTPVLSKPNGYQTHIDFKECWITSKLRTGNTFVLKQRDNRGVVVAMYVLDPLRVQPLIAYDGSIFYQLSMDFLSELLEPTVTVPASEIIHDRMNCLFHPLVGVSPLFACALQAGLGLEIERNSGRFFANGAKISGTITVPGSISDEKAAELKKKFNDGYTGKNAGNVAVLADGLKFTPLTMTSTDAQLIDQLKFTDNQVCTAFHVPPYKVGVGTMPSYDNIEALNQQYASECLQINIEKMEALLVDGLNADPYDICLDQDSLLRMDTRTLIETLSESVKGSVSTPNEARAKLGMKPLPGGDTIYMQQQNFSLQALAKRDALDNPFVIDRPTANPTPSADGNADQADPAAKGISEEELDEAFALVRKHIGSVSGNPLLLQAA